MKRKANYSFNGWYESAKVAIADIAVIAVIGKDQNKLFKKCVNNDIPVFILSGNDLLTVDVLKYYYKLAHDKGCDSTFLAGLKMRIEEIQAHYTLSAKTIKLPD